MVSGNVPRCKACSVEKREGFVWLKASKEDAQFLMYDYKQAAEEFSDAMNGPSGFYNPPFFAWVSACMSNIHLWRVYPSVRRDRSAGPQDHLRVPPPDHTGDPGQLPDGSTWKARYDDRDNLLAEFDAPGQMPEYLNGENDLPHTIINATYKSKYL